MSLSYTYAVVGLKTTSVNTLTNVITSIQWTLTGTDSAGNTGSFSGVTPYSLNANTFIPFESLTETDIVSWIQATVSGDSLYFQHINDQIESQININTVTMVDVDTNALPWAPRVDDTNSTTTDT